MIKAQITHLLSFQDLESKPVLESAWQGPLRAGYILIASTFGLLGLWAAFAPLDSAVVGPGIIAVESNRKTVQHLEGGIIREIRVRDGDLVQAGDLLFRLEDTQARAQLDLVANQLTVALAREARLLAEQESAADIIFAAEVVERSASPLTRKAMQDERNSFRERRALLDSQIEAQHKQQAAAKRETEGLALEYKSARDQMAQIDLELPGLKTLLSKGFVALNRVTTLQRERLRLEGVQARSQTDFAKAQIAFTQAETQILQLKAQFQQSVATDIVDTRKSIADLRERFNVAQDILTRTEVRSPQTGVAQGRKVATVGAVIRPGDTLVDIAPVNEALVVQAQIDPKDINVLKKGMQAEVRFPGFKATETPVMYGKIRGLSNDRVTDPTNSRVAYFAVEIEVDMSTVPEHVRDRLRAGMDAEVFLKTGERSALRYMVEPLEERLRSSFRER